MPMEESEARVYLSSHPGLPRLREPCTGLSSHLSVAVDTHCPKLSCLRCHGTGEVARDWHLEDLYEACNAGGHDRACVAIRAAFNDQTTPRALLADSSIAAALALKAEEV